MQCKQMMTDLPYHRLTVELCHLKKLCKTCATAEAPNACSHAMWQRAWTTTKKQLEETGDFDKDWPNTDERYLHAREKARQLALQRAQAAQAAKMCQGYATRRKDLVLPARWNPQNLPRPLLEGDGLPLPIRTRGPQAPLLRGALATTEQV